MAKSVLHLSESRGLSDHGWLQSYHTFSFADYYDPERVHFGALRVLNDDTVAPGEGFGKHPHDNMEIISIPLEGDLEHKDSMGNISVIRKGDLQVMSAGTGIFHSEYNRNSDSLVKFLQIWVIPNRKNVIPRYDQIKLIHSENPDRLLQVLSPSGSDEGVWIYQNAWFHMGSLSQGFSTEYDFHSTGNGLYCFIIKGKVTIAGQHLDVRDGFGIWETDKVSIRTESESEILLMEVPMVL